jgi:tetratricopeptide (TPR) repeat protein
MKQDRNKLYVIPICVALVLTTIIAYEPVRHNGFISFDDNAYIVENSYVKSGFTLRNLVWAFTKTHAYNWHPLTWVSHMLDCQLYGLNPVGHHSTSLFFHVMNTLLLFLVFNRITGSVWPSAFVAALFALHPLHVESVAWASERKDVLAGFFWLVVMWSYARYVEGPTVKRYLVVLIVFAFGLMAKQMLVTLPFVLLLLDYWPLGRLRIKRRSFRGSAPVAISVRRCALEKVPLLILSTIAAVTVYAVQQLTGTVRSFAEYPLTWRIENALVAYTVYIGKMFWPCNLAIFYPHPGGDLPAWQITTAIFLLAIITIGVILKRKQCPYLTVGWLWYLGTLVPVIGLVQVGVQAYADRYTYIPLIGLFIAVAWGIPDIFSRLKNRETVLSLSAAVLLAVLGVMTWVQVGQWRSDIVLYKHATTVVQDNWWAHNNLGIAYYYGGELDKASKHFAEALRIRPTFQGALSGMGAVLLAQGELDEAIKYLRDALQLKPNSPGEYVYLAQAHTNLGVALAKKGRLDEAIKHHFEALRIMPNLPVAHSNLGIVLDQKGETEKAVEHFAEAVRLKPDYLNARIQLGHSLVKLGRIESAVDQYQKILQYKPNHPEALNALAWVWATTENAKFQNPIAAVGFAQKACELSNYEHPGVLDTLAAAYAASGNFAEAVKTAEKALKLAEDANEKNLAEEIQKRLELYKAGQPYHEK